MKFMIIGNARHGKDTVAEIMKEVYGLKFTSSSWACAGKVMMPAFQRTWADDPANNPFYKSVEDCFNSRHNYRKFWYDEICRYCDGDRARLVREILHDNDIYVGCRQIREFMTARNEGLFDTTIWVDRSTVIPPEAPESMSLQPWMADYWLDNNGTLAELKHNVITLVDRLLFYQPLGEVLKRRLKELAPTLNKMKPLAPEDRVPIGNSRPAALEIIRNEE
jgi:hypothetical protein